MPEQIYSYRSGCLLIAHDLEDLNLLLAERRARGTSEEQLLDLKRWHLARLSCLDD